MIGKRRPWLALAVLLAGLGAGCASTPDQPLAEGDPAARNIDPIEPTNRGIFRFNDGLDGWIFEPAGTGWGWILPETVRLHLGQAYNNLNFPGQLVNNLFQAEFKQAGVDVARFLTNSTVGLAGLFDPASGLGWTSRGEDFGQTLAVWGVPEGPYLMLPFLGPSGGRDLAALPIDFALDPLTWVRPPLVSAAVSGAELVNARSLNMDRIRQARGAALDWYVFVRNAHRQQRAMAVTNGEPEPDAPEDDLYELDEDDE